VTGDQLTQSPPEQAIEARVLVVDDDESNRESLSRRLRRRGVTVDIAVDGADALLAIDSTRYDLVLLDVMMPGLSGLEVLERVRATKPPTELPIIMATANDGAADIAYALEHGANDYVTKPIDFTITMARVKTQLNMVQAVRQVMALKHDLSLRNAELENALEMLRRSAERARGDMDLAARVQATFLPREMPGDARFSAAWRYLPCDQLAGDALNICPLGPDHVAFYVLDVTGHGVASSLTAVTAARMLAPAHDPASILVGPDGPLPPAAVMTELAARFPYDSDTGQFITCFYALLNLRTGVIEYVSAGHPDAILVPAEGPARMLAGTGLPIGLDDQYQQQTAEIRPGDRIWLYSDGVIEAMRPDSTLYGTERLRNELGELRALPMDVAQQELLDRLTAWRASAELADDVSILTIALAAKGQPPA
jgi:sigma-B regulation protein RsbU (phosphoserine phosphatase)